MPEVALDDAVRMLAEKVQTMDVDDLRDAHNELFPESPIPPIDSFSRGESVRQQVLDYLSRDVAIEEILDFWNVVFPEDWNVYFDDETRMIHYLVESEAIQ